MKEILVLCPFGVDKGLLSKAAGLSGGALRVLIPACLLYTSDAADD